MAQADRVSLGRRARGGAAVAAGGEDCEVALMADERFMRHHYGASGYVPPVTADRDYLAEALAIIDGTSMMCPERAHLVAVMEAFSGLREIEDSGKRPTAPKSASDGGAIPASTSPKGYREPQCCACDACLELEDLQRETNVFWSGEDALEGRR